jgi:hypothetical protein
VILVGGGAKIKGDVGKAIVDSNGHWWKHGSWRRKMGGEGFDTLDVKFGLFSRQWDRRHSGSGVGWRRDDRWLTNRWLPVGKGRRSRNKRGGSSSRDKG